MSAERFFCCRFEPCVNAFRIRRKSGSTGVINSLSTYECGAGKAHCDIGARLGYS